MTMAWSIVAASAALGRGWGGELGASGGVIWGLAQPIPDVRP